METNDFGKKIFERLQSGIRADEMLESLLNYLEVNLEILKIDAHEGVSRVLSKIAEFIVLVILGSLLLIFGSIALALSINFVFDTPSFVGFSVVTFLYFSVLIFYYLFVKKKADEKISENVENAVDKVKIPKPENNAEQIEE